MRPTDVYYLKLKTDKCSGSIKLGVSTLIAAKGLAREWARAIDSTGRWQVSVTDANGLILWNVTER